MGAREEGREREKKQKGISKTVFICREHDYVHRHPPFGDRERAWARPFLRG